ncbi:MAG: hypothetical protein M1426_00815 [Patescibacteria group bacterium]|nr:hypothetical protein [Patescibacteria group bacterium]
MDNQQNQNPPVPETKPVPPPVNPVPQEPVIPVVPPVNPVPPPVPPVVTPGPVQENLPNKPKTILYLLIVLVIIATIASLGVILFNYSKPSTPVSQVTATPTAVAALPTPTMAAEDPATQKLTSQGTSDEIADIEKDLNNTDLTNIDKEVGDINSELNQP